MSQSKTINLTGTKTKIEFDKPFAFVECNNLGESDVLFSTKSNFERGDDDVVIVRAGSSATIGDVGVPAIKTVYLNGNGEVQLIGKSFAGSSFKAAVKGGDSSSNPEIEQEIENLRDDINSLMNSSGLGRVTIQRAFHFNRGYSNTWFKAATLAVPNAAKSPFAARGDFFDANGSNLSSNGYFSFILAGGMWDIENTTKFYVYDYVNSGCELALLYVPDESIFELWYKIGTNNSGDIHAAIMYSLTDFTVSDYSGNSPVGWNLPDYGVRIPSIPMYQK